MHEMVWMVPCVADWGCFRTLISSVFLCAVEMVVSAGYCQRWISLIYTGRYIRVHVSIMLSFFMVFASLAVIFLGLVLFSKLLPISRRGFGSALYKNWVHAPTQFSSLHGCFRSVSPSLRKRNRVVSSWYIKWWLTEPNHSKSLFSFETLSLRSP